MIRSLFSKLLLSHLLILLVTTSAIGLFLPHLITNYLIEAKRAELIRQGTATVEFLDSSIKNKSLLPQLLDNLGKLSGTQLWIMDNRQRLVAGQPPRRWHHRMTKILGKEFGAKPPNNRAKNENESGRHGHENGREDVPYDEPGSNAPACPRRGDFFNGETKSWIYRARNDDDPSIVAAIPFPSSPDAALFLYTPITGVAKTSAAIQSLLVYAILSAFLLAGLFALFLSRSLTRPISQISRAAEKFAEGDYSVRTPSAGKDEIGRLGLTFNHMADTLERVEKNRREFLSDVTHELKTPIASIQAVTESILDGIVTDEETRRRYLNATLSETKRMNHLISELLDLARLESGQIEFQLQEIPLSAFLQAQKDKYEPLLAEKNLTFFLDDAGEAKTITADPLRLEQILANLISNAIRHAPKNSSITLKSRRQGGALLLAVNSGGEGIPSEQLPYIWERFYRVDKSRARNQGGTGLGLAITKKIVEGMGGKIDVASTPGEETTFSVTLPFK